MRKPVWRVLAWNPKRRVWTVRRTFDTKAEAQAHAEAMQHHDPGLRVRVKPATEVVLTIKQTVVNDATKFRQAMAARMSVLSDDKKRYKSPG